MTIGKKNKLNEHAGVLIQKLHVRPISVTNSLQTHAQNPGAGQCGQRELMPFKFKKGDEVMFPAIEEIAGEKQSKRLKPVKTKISL